MSKHGVRIIIFMRQVRRNIEMSNNKNENGTPTDRIICKLWFELQNYAKKHKPIVKIIDSWKQRGGREGVRFRAEKLAKKWRLRISVIFTVTWILRILVICHVKNSLYTTQCGKTKPTTATWRPELCWHTTNVEGRHRQKDSSFHRNQEWKRQTH